MEKKAFTLAEVLITLAIVGTISAITIPALLTNIGNAQNVALLKKEYAALSTAFTLIENDGIGSDDYVFSSGAAFQPLLDLYAAKLNVIKNCGTGAGCLYATPVYYPGGSSQLTANFYSNYRTYGSMLLADGSLMQIVNSQHNCGTSYGSGPLVNTCGYIYIDINGAKGPNTVGKDFFLFWITKKGIYPAGIYESPSYSCDGTTYATSMGCTATVLAGG